MSDAVTTQHADEVKAFLRQASERAAHWLDDLEHPPTKETVRRMVSQYYFVNRAFVLGIIRYAGRLARILLDENQEMQRLMTESELENVLATVTKIGADECQAGGVYAGRNMHHNLLLRMGPKVGLNPEDALTTDTAQLVILIDWAFLSADPFQGLALVSAVEAIALPMVKALREYFGSYVPEDGSEPFDTRELEHLDLHIELEVHHAAESSEIYEHIALTPEDVMTLAVATNNLESLFGDFWRQFATK